MKPSSKFLMALSLFLFLIFCGKCAPDSLSAENSINKNSQVIDFPLNQFSISLVQDWIEIKWKTQNENLVKGFEIQSSEDGTNFKTLRWEPAFGKANGADYLIINEIEIFDKTLSFRIKIVFENNDVAFSKIEKFKTPSQKKFLKIQEQLKDL